jgi:hypothetical protein
VSEKVDIQIVLPPCSDDEVSDGLRGLTEAIHRAEKADGSPGGILGGEFGYGANFENDAFMMHRYCWCEKDDCPWCAGDAGPFSNHSLYWSEGNTTAPNFLHKPSQSRVWWYKYIGRGMEMDLRMAWDAILTDCLASLSGKRV